MLRHGDVEKVIEGVWRVDGTLAYLPMPRTMTLARLPSGGLFVHSAIELDDARARAVEALGKPEVIVVPSPYHTLDARKLKARWPSARLVAPAAARPVVERKIGAGAIEASCEETLHALGVTFHTVPGLKPQELVYEVAGALVFCDALFNLQEHLPGAGGVVFRVIGSTGFCGMTWIGRNFLARDTKAFARWLRDVAATLPIDAITVAHGPPIVGREACRVALLGAASRLGVAVG